MTMCMYIILVIILDRFSHIHACKVGFLCLILTGSTVGAYLVTDNDNDCSYPSCSTALFLLIPLISLDSMCSTKYLDPNSPTAFCQLQGQCSHAAT